MRPSVELAQKALAGMGRAQRKDGSVSIELIQKVTAGYFGIPLESLVGPTRKQEVAIARHVSMYLCRALTGKPLKAIGNHFGKRDHTTVIHACRNVNQRIDAA
jgi:chromosomal replication initiator protein